MRAILAKFPCFAIVYHIGTTILPWGTGSIQEGGVNTVAYDPGLDTIEFRICLSGSSTVIQLLVSFMIPPFAPHAAFCPLRMVIPSVNSKQPVGQQAKSQGRGPKEKYQGSGIKTWGNKIAKISYPGWSPETANFAILDPVWIITTPRAMKILGSQVHVSLCWTSSKSHMEWRI